MRNEDIIVYVVWAVAAVLSLALIGTAIAKGFSRKSKLTLVYWRQRKFTSAILSSVSLFLFILSFDQLVRGSWQAESREYAEDRYYELKLITSMERATACGRVPDWTPGNLLDTPLKELCFAWQNIDNSYHIDFLRKPYEFKLIDVYSANLIPQDTRKRIEGIIQRINETAPPAASRLLLSMKARLAIAVVAIFTLIFAIAGSVGEAAYQLRVAEDSERK